MRRTRAEIQKFFLQLNEARSRETAVCCFSPVTEEERMEKQADKNPKRQRDPLEENIPASNELEAVLKRRRLAAGGVENHNPEQRAVRSPARSRHVESEVKPDTPAIASVRLRVQQLAQRRDGGAALVQRCMSDPGAESPSSTLLRDVCHIGEGEFISRLERFKTPTPESSPAPATPSTRQLSSFVHNMQQQLNATATPSSKEASRIRQAREDELKSLRVQPLTENMWLKRSFSDPSLAERVTPPSSSCVCQRTRAMPWPPLQFENDDSSIDFKESECSLNFSGVNETMGDSFSISSTFTAETQPPATALCAPDSVVRPHEGMSTSALIDKMFEDVLQAADREEEEEKEEEERGNDTADREEEEEKEEEERGNDTADREEEEEKEEEERGNDSSVSESREEADVETAETEPKLKSPSPSPGGDAEACDGEQKECENWNEEEEVAGEREESAVCNEEDFLSLPPSCVLSPLSKSVEAVVTPMRLTATAPPPMVPCDPAEEEATPPAPPLYSIDAYRSQRKIPPPSSQSVTPGVQKQRGEKSRIKPTVNTKETIKALSDEASKLQTVINQTLQALSCCSDEEHGKGSLQEAEAEKLLLVSSEKRAALLAEISRLREGGAGREPDLHPVRLQPCRGTVSINNIQLPLKVEFVCSARTARPTHYFFILIRYGACNIVATPLATAADAENGDTITFPTSITLQDIRSNFEIDVEVYSLCNSAANSSSANVQQHRSSTRSKATPKKLLSSIKKSNPCSTTGASSALDPQRSSNFSLVGSHKITLSSLGQSKFLLDKMKFEGKIRRLLGDEFQEKVPFLSPLEGHIYLRLHSDSHSNVQHQGFLTMFEDVSGFGAWQRLFFKLEGGILYYWNYPNETSGKPAEGSISLCGFDSVRPVERDSCARPHTFELVNSRTLQQDQSHTLTKSWFSADTREERADWMEKLNQVLLDLHTWSRRAAGGENDRANISSITATSRESVL
ncbi:anillin isoform X1 [Pangasianodon hypophthalmus]|uniref:anillin isoform X1 n=2 Tax=Pangasianodon hypophthalmus TaxID=310915 RepID=UPI002306E20E|nr:anillin isoform X1 [Pangasianodon hypophthalmus]